MPRTRRNNLRKLVRNEILANEKKTTEVKHKTISYGISPNTTPFGYNMLEFISEGSSAESRDGNRLQLLSESMRMNIQGENPSSYVRIMLVETREPLPYDTLFSLYDGTAVLQNPTLGINSSLDYDVVKKTHMDKLLTLREIVSGVTPIRYFKKYQRYGKNGKKIFYDGNTTGLNSGNIMTHLYLLFMSDSSVIPHPRVTAGHYIRFTDK